LTTKACAPGNLLTSKRVFTQEDLFEWARLTGDANAIHREAVAPFAAPIVPGLLLASTFPALFARHHPGAVYRTQSLRFDAAVPVDAEVVSEIAVDAVRATRRGAFATCATTLRVAATNDLCVSGSARLWLPFGSDVKLPCNQTTHQTN